MNSMFELLLTFIMRWILLTTAAISFAEIVMIFVISYIDGSFMAIFHETEYQIFLGAISLRGTLAILVADFWFKIPQHGDYDKDWSWSLDHRDPDFKWKLFKRHEEQWELKTSIDKRVYIYFFGRGIMFWNIEQKH